MELSLPELEALINHWRARTPARGNEVALSAEVSVLATVYALMIFNGRASLPLECLDLTTRALLDAWRARYPPA